MSYEFINYWTCEVTKEDKRHVESLGRHRFENAYVVFPNPFEIGEYVRIVGTNIIGRVDTILFPSSFFDIKKIDEDLQIEYDAAMETGLWDVILFSYDKWFNNGEIMLSQNPEQPITAVYRGWMMKADSTAEFYGGTSAGTYREI